MVTTTRSFSVTARPIRPRCPPCRAPMVGTMPTLNPAAWHSVDHRRRSAGVSRTLRTSVERGSIVRESPLAHVVGIGTRAGDDATAQVVVGFHEFRNAAPEVAGDPEQVMDHQHLGIA